ncbi:MAG: carbohydrate kinase family protein [bacterium]|nr:carbohydrate kinase family protein [bacterium]MDE0600933.1 carbohydrate kinase family protein [bacterium]
MIDVVGDACVDLVLPVLRVPEPDEKVHTRTAAMSPGGVALNVAVALARLGSEVALHARIGRDAFGSMVLETLHHEAVNATGVAVDTSIDTYFTMSLITDDSPEKRMVVAVTPGLYPETATLGAASWGHTAPFDPDAAAWVTDRWRTLDVPFSIDLEPACLPDDPAEIASVTTGADTLIANARTRDLLAESAEEALGVLSGPLGGRHAVITQGADGIVFRSEGTTGRIPAHPVEAVDTTGAGDGFAAGYIWARTRGAGVVEALEVGVLVGALACRTLGALPSFPRRAEVEPLLGTLGGVGS